MGCDLLILECSNAYNSLYNFEDASSTTKLRFVVRFPIFTNVDPTIRIGGQRSHDIYAFIPSDGTVRILHILRINRQVKSTLTSTESFQ